jgi:hypothetical protein
VIPEARRLLCSTRLFLAVSFSSAQHGEAVRACVQARHLYSTVIGLLLPWVVGEARLRNGGMARCSRLPLERAGTHAGRTRGFETRESLGGVRK